MIKNDKGITLLALVITILILSILTTIGINVTMMSMNDVKNSRLETELGMVRQVIVEQYSMATAVNKIKISMTEPQVSFWIGEKIEDFSTINLPSQNAINETEEIKEFYKKHESYTCVFQEDFYYRLDTGDLEKIGIGDSQNQYIVNYKTGEVYNETMQKNEDGDLLYLPPIRFSTTQEKVEDTTSFNDWETP